MPPRPSAGPTLPEPPADVSPCDLPADLYERWEERACIMHYDGRLPWREAEALGMADILAQTDPLASKGGAAPVRETAKAEPPAPVVQTRLFAAEEGPYA
jgi:hypothetical protein